MIEKSIIIIGAGLAGLSAGCYARMNGYKTRIFEMHTIPGGLCTSWNRKGYVFDGCIHYMMGSRVGIHRRIYEELGAMRERTIIDSDELLRVERSDGKTWIVYSDLDRLEQHMNELSSADTAAIKELCRSARRFVGYDPPMEKPMDQMGFIDMLKMIKDIPALSAMGKYGKITMQEFAKRFQDPFDDKIRSYYQKRPIYGPYIQISLGIDRDLSNEPHAIILGLEEPMVVGDQTRRWLSVKHYCYDQSIAPSGKSVVTVSFLFNNYEYWKKLSHDREQYENAKRSLADAVISALNKRFPGIKEQIEVVDVATPVTYERYTGNWKGSYMGWLAIPSSFGSGMSRTLPGLDGFYMAGHWIFPGNGVSGATTSGRHVIQDICKRDKKRFTTSVP